MNKLENIDWDTIKTFIRGNTLLCALAVLDVFLLFAALGRSDNNEDILNQTYNLQIKEKQIKMNLEKLKGMERDFETLKKTKAEVLQKCLNFGKKTVVYNFLKRIDGFLQGSKINISNTNLYDITKSRNINFNQDLSEFDDDNVLSNYSVLFSAKVADFEKFLKQLNELPYCINLQKLEIRNVETKGNNALLNVNLSFALLGKIQLREQ